MTSQQWVTPRGYVTADGQPPPPGGSEQHRLSTVPAVKKPPVTEKDLTSGKILE